MNDATWQFYAGRVPHVNVLKIDCEGAELAVLQGIEKEDWSRIDMIVAEVHDIEGRLDAVRSLLNREGGYDRIFVKAEPGFERAALRNVFASRS